MHFWWIELFTGDDVILNMDNQWMFEIIESVLRWILEMEAVKDSN